MREARAEGEKLLEESRVEMRKLRVEIDALDRARRNHLAHMRSLVERQLSDLQAAEAASLPGPDSPGRGGDENGDERPAVRSPSWLDAHAKAE